MFIFFTTLTVVLINGTCCADNGSRRPGNNTAYNRTTDNACVLIFARLCISRITMLPIVFVNSTQCADHSTGTTCDNATYNGSTNDAGIFVILIFLFRLHFHDFIFGICRGSENLLKESRNKSGNTAANTNNQKSATPFHQC